MKKRKTSVSTKQCPEILEHFAETSQEFVEQKLARISWLDFAENTSALNIIVDSTVYIAVES